MAIDAAYVRFRSVFASNESVMKITFNPQVFYLHIASNLGILDCMSPTPEPRLAPPGAGLPKVELLIGRLLFALRWRMGSRAIFESRFSEERTAIKTIITGLTSDLAARRVLISRIAGLEDSSRYWSVWMTLERLRIVNLAIAGTIAKLARDEMPSGTASTAAVKPSEGIGEQVVAQYENACDLLLNNIASVGDLKTKLRYVHPWFGPLNAFQWYAMAAGHMGIHRAQLERICLALKTNS